MEKTTINSIWLAVVTLLVLFSLLTPTGLSEEQMQQIEESREAIENMYETLNTNFGIVELQAEQIENMSKTIENQRKFNLLMHNLTGETVSNYADQIRQNRVYLERLLGAKIDDIANR